MFPPKSGSGFGKVVYNSGVGLGRLGLGMYAAKEDPAQTRYLGTGKRNVEAE